ncbi:MAG: filamentous hemagglutinin N-terminal domain-containing protein [Candidatus Gastranaerophilales bacterium]|nr:filamentous hemagglutinin N-terminal domain-containing protein [Candidatus Gastranaerophilales bacterium]
MKKLLSTTIAVGIFASMSISPALAAVGANVLPSLDSATNADVTTSGNNMNIQIQGGQGGVGTLNWNSYHIGKDATVNYEFSAHNQTALNKVDAAGGISQIYGKITSSGCAGCGYDATGKVILLNPNGVLFGDGANVNLNSFTVSNMDGVYKNNELQLTKGSNQGDFGIRVQDGATIHGAKNVTFAANDIILYKGSKITTDTVANVDDTAYGKVKLVTADGVNFTYYNNGAVSKISDITGSADKMLISINGDITSGNIDIRNYSTDEASQINLKDASLKAVKAVKGNDGNIWLTASNNVITQSSKLETVNGSADAASRNGGNVQILAGQKATVGSTDINAVGNVDIKSNGYDVVVGSGSTITSAKDVNITAAGIASVQGASKINAKNVKINGGERAQVVEASEVNADTFEITADNVWFEGSNIKAAKDIKATATKGFIQADNTSLAAEKVALDAKTNVAGTINLNNSKTTINAGNDVNVKLSGVGNRQNGLIAKAGNNMAIEADTLSVSSLISGNDMTIKANEVISGYDKTTNSLRTAGDSADRAYIEVGGKFTSTPNFEVTDSAGLNAEKTYQSRHHIQYGNGSEKILLVNNRPYVAPEEPKPVQPVEPQDDLDVDDQQASMLNKLPRQPQSMNNNTNIADGRTTFVDVFAAASQIEIEEDEEE